MIITSDWSKKKEEKKSKLAVDTPVLSLQQGPDLLSSCYSYFMHKSTEFMTHSGRPQQTRNITLEERRGTGEEGR